ncbi:PTS sugar transporter subunit IIA [Lacticaseibacillus pabuli]|uniref:PTS sugar transporter subunit IIA n=1 Tax=Lacticaseibacillus pabuli TaxID=3025672 RepID=A0ABY7WSK7_9LACO|nr:PTS sugar transporter subunit IIA [Lacticaseibacillus sp. KACC 23028]WDF82721.1 PTS sugar transporter subunit IIA [Lacticaseibacillus sp. KACC 23028]
MFGLLTKKNVVTEVEITSTNQIDVLKELAARTASKLNLDEQEMRSGLFASAGANTNRITGNRIFITHATAASIKAPKAVLITLAPAVNWNGTNAIDYALVVVMPADAGDTSYDEIADKAEAVFSDHASELDGLIGNASELNKIVKEII